MAFPDLGHSIKDRDGPELARIRRPFTFFDRLDPATFPLAGAFSGSERGIKGVLPEKNRLLVFELPG